MQRFRLSIYTLRTILLTISASTVRLLLMITANFITWLVYASMFYMLNTLIGLSLSIAALLSYLTYYLVLLVLINEIALAGRRWSLSRSINLFISLIGTFTLHYAVLQGSFSLLVWLELPAFVYCPEFVHALYLPCLSPETYAFLTATLIATGVHLLRIQHIFGARRT